MSGTSAALLVVCLYTLAILACVYWRLSRHHKAVRDNYRSITRVMLWMVGYNVIYRLATTKAAQEYAGVNPASLNTLAKHYMASDEALLACVTASIQAPVDQMPDELRNDAEAYNLTVSYVDASFSDGHTTRDTAEESLRRAVEILSLRNSELPSRMDVIRHISEVERVDVHKVGRIIDKFISGCDLMAAKELSSEEILPGIN